MIVLAFKELNTNLDQYCRAGYFLEKNSMENLECKNVHGKSSTRENIEN